MEEVQVLADAIRVASWVIFMGLVGVILAVTRTGGRE